MNWDEQWTQQDAAREKAWKQAEENMRQRVQQAETRTRQLEAEIKAMKRAMTLPPAMVQVEVREDEAQYLGDARCDACGHLYALHNDHCCSFCMVDDCRCEDWKLKDE